MTRSKSSSSTGVLDASTTIAGHGPVHFPGSIPGLDQALDWEITELTEARPLFRMRSLNRPSLTLLVVDPRRVVEGYDPEIPEAALARIQAESAENLMILATVTSVSESEAFVNLHAPLVVNPECSLGVQVILEDSRWPLRYALTANEKMGQGGPSHARSESKEA